MGKNMDEEDHSIRREGGQRASIRVLTWRAVGEASSPIVLPEELAKVIPGLDEKGIIIIFCEILTPWRSEGEGRTGEPTSDFASERDSEQQPNAKAQA